jgi:hypothetical protein
MSPAIRLAFLVATSGCVARAQTAAESTATLDVIVRDSASQAPLAHAWISVRPGSRVRDAGGTGWGRWKDIRSPIVHVEVRCPSRHGYGRLLLARRIAIAPGATLRLPVDVAPGLCVERAYAERPGEFHGIWSVGFEHNRFSICADSTLGFAADPETETPFAYLGEDASGAWVTFSDRARTDLRRRPKAKKQEDGYQQYFARFRGTMKGPGRYGHLGVSPYEFEVDSVVSLLPDVWGGPVCDHPPDGGRRGTGYGRSGAP